MQATETQPQLQPQTTPKQHSCIRCFKRKVKCDKQLPCAACVRQNAECAFRIPERPRPRKDRSREDILKQRLQQYEAFLRQSGIDPATVPLRLETVKGGQLNHESNSAQNESETTTEPMRVSSNSSLLFKHGQSRYLDNLWTRVVGEIPDEADTFGDSSEDEIDPSEIADFIFELHPRSTSIKQFHPSTEHILEMWQIFVENVNPLLKIVHEPTLELAIKNATVNLGNVSKELEALMFAIYAFAVMSLTDADCEERFSETRQVLLSRYRITTKSALARAKFLGSRDMVVFQAYLLHLISMRNVYDSHTMWSLLGIAGRLAEGMGLHRDGVHVGLSPFETEIRRRVWWQMKMLDFHTADLVGSAKAHHAIADPQLTRLPTNVNDDQLYPGMSSFPADSKDMTDMCFCSLHGELGRFWTENVARLHEQIGNDAGDSLGDTSGSKVNMPEIDRIMDQLEQIMENKYIRRCEPTQPAQFLTLLIARMAVTNGRFLAHHPRQWSSVEDIPDSERQLAWNLSIKALETVVTVRSSRQLDRFIWHTSSGFPWAQIIHILDRLRAEPLLADAIKAWRLINEALENRPDLLSDKKLITIALGNLCLEAWDARESALSKQGKSLPRQSSYIADIRSQREVARARRSARARKEEQDVLSHTVVKASTPITSDTIWQPDTTLVSSFDQITATKMTDLSDTAMRQPISLSHTDVGPSRLSNDDNTLWLDANPEDWTTALATVVNDPMALDADPLLDGGMYNRDLNMQPIDWYQWDTLIKEWDGSVPE